MPPSKTKRRLRKDNQLAVACYLLSLIQTPHRVVGFLTPSPAQQFQFYPATRTYFIQNWFENDSFSTRLKRREKLSKDSYYFSTEFESKVISDRPQSDCHPSSIILSSRSLTTAPPSIQTSQFLSRLTHEEEIALLHEMKSPSTDATISQRARQKLLMHNLPLVKSIATKIIRSRPLTRNNSMSPMMTVRPTELQVGSALTKDDLVHEGTIGLAEALDRYDFRFSQLNSTDPSLPTGARLGTYATYWIRARILRAIQNREHAFRFPERVLQASHRLAKAAKELGLDWHVVVETQDCSHRKEEKQRLRSLLCHTAGITSDLLFEEAVRVRTMSAHGVHTEIESWMSSTINRMGEKEQPFEGDEVITLEESQRIHDTLSRFLMPREVRVLSLRYGLNCPEEERMTQDRSTSLKTVFRDYEAEAEDDLFGPNGILPHYTNVPLEERIPNPYDFKSSSFPSSAINNSIVNADNPRPLTEETTIKQIKLSSSTALLPFHEVGKQMQFSGEYCRRLCAEALKKLIRAVEEGRLAESDFSLVM